jgi:hypothetical protein
MKRTTAPNSVGGQHVDRNPGVSSGSKGTAEDRNNLQEELCHLIEGLGVALDGTDQYQHEKAAIARGLRVGQVYDMAAEETPVGWASARSTTNPGNPEYCPTVPLWDSDHDLTSAVYPKLVPFLRAQKAKAWNGSSYTTDHSVTVAAHVVTGSGTPWDNLLAALAEDYLVHTGANTVSGGFGYGASGSVWRSLNVGGTDYAIAAGGVNPGAHTVTITGDSLSGAQTAIWYPYRIAGVATSARVFQDSGRATVSAGAQECVGGGRRRDRIQGHWHTSNTGPGIVSAPGTGGNVTATAGGSVWTTGAYMAAAVTDTANGNPRLGGTTDTRANVVFRFIWAAVMLA